MNSSLEDKPEVAPQVGTGAVIEVWPAHRRNYVMSVVCLVGVFNLLDRQIITILLEPIKHSFGASDTAMGFLVGMAFAGFYLAASFPIARWVDRGVRRSIMALCLGVWSFMTMLGGFSPSFAFLATTRIGVAIGEAGATPAIHSIISDLYPLEKRGAALGVLNGMQSVGIALGVFLGGWLADAYSWRVALIAVGLPGLLLALLVRFTVAEPPRGMSDAQAAPEAIPPLREVFTHLWKIKSYRCFVLIATFGALTGYGILGWGPTFFIRVHDMTTAEVGLWFGLSTVAGLFIGNVLCGFLADWLGKKDLRGYMWVAAAGPLLSLPFGILTLLWPHSGGAFVSYFIFFVLFSVHLPPSQAMVQNVAPQRMRGTAIVILAVMQTFVGIGMGPIIVGIGNDLLASTFGSGAVRYSLLFVMIWALFASACALLATRWLRADCATALDAQAGQDQSDGS